MPSKVLFIKKESDNSIRFLVLESPVTKRLYIGHVEAQLQFNEVTQELYIPVHQVLENAKARGLEITCGEENAIVNKLPLKNAE